MLVANSGMDASQINFEEPPALRWQSVINEAEKQGTLHKLVPVLLARYPENRQLIAACAPWEAADPVQTVPNQKQKTPAVELVPLIVPKEFADIAYEDTVATIASLRMSIASQEKRLADLESWRIRVSTMSSAKIAKLTDEEDQQ